MVKTFSLLVLLLITELNPTKIKKNKIYAYLYKPVLHAFVNLHHEIITLNALRFEGH